MERTSTRRALASICGFRHDIQNAPSATPAPVLPLTPDEAVRKRDAAAIPGATGDTTVTAPAAGSATTPMEIMAALTAW